MSKPQPATEVLLSIDACRSATEAQGQVPRLARALLAVIAASGSLAGCLSPNGGETGTTDVMLGSDTGTSSSSEDASGGSTTQPPIMTTTVEPETTEAPGSESSDGTTASTAGSSSTTTDIPPECGDGSLQPGEECDAGLENSDEGLCTSTCMSAKCGDGFVQPGEVCDDGVNDNTYGKCAPGCVALAPHCGDGTIDEVESCDGGDPWNAQGGCLLNCQYAQSCKQIRESFPDDETIVDGVYTIKRANKLIDVYCEMNADGGGYTFLKVALPDPASMNAKQAEAECKKYGMGLLAPRTPLHVVAAGLVAKSALLEPVGGGTTKGDIKYLSILGIYPVVPGQSCVGAAFNSEACTAWKANSGPFHISAVPVNDQPSNSNCYKCSMFYQWTDGGLLESYEASKLDGDGPTAKLFMCDTGDKFGDEG